MNIRSAIFACWFAVFATTALSQSNINLGSVNTDPNAPVEVTAESLEVNQDTNQAIFTGNVLIIQGDLRVTAPRVEVLYQDGGGDISQLLATGGVTLVSATEAAEAQEADYNLAAGTLTLTTDVVVTQGPSVISADKMVMNLDDGSAVMEGRVRTILQQSEN